MPPTRVLERLREMAPLTAWRRRGPADLLGLDRATIVQAVKVALSAGLAWALAQLILHSTSPIWAPITASLIALLTVRASLKDAGQKVLAVVVGLVVAILLGGFIGLHAWSIAIIVGIGFLVGKVLRLAPGAAAQIPISGLFVLALGTGQVRERVLDTLIGAIVAVLVNLVVIPPNHVNAGRRAVADLSDGVVDALGAMADGLAAPWRAEHAARWLRTAREQASVAATAESDVDQAEQSLALHPGRASWTGALARTQQALDTLLIVEVQVRVVARTLRDTAQKVRSSDGEQPPYPMTADVLTTTAGAVAAFSAALLAEDDPSSGDGEPLALAHRAVARARARLAEIDADLADMLAASLSRGIHLGTLVVETGRILDELEAGLQGSAPAGPPGDSRADSPDGSPDDGDGEPAERR
ncbi:FUSC family protein [Nakamurella flavida]|uniref:FUSC family protein n=1 Tax=Nakamurella flavida TaxID=363630 RepID=A0A938YCZ7_9ACTN|nr:FUSC family protein [Nakamurella flavida]MBM9475385.1 FUSC family protein [Nakamurella flavida]MDP9776965.1 hypothetical protein [Nakamurella flavida]